MRKFFEHPATFPLLTTALFALAIFVGVIAAQLPGVDLQRWGAYVAKALLAMAFAALGGWFLHAFTHSDQLSDDEPRLAQQRASMFRFAYMFSLFSFALLVLPFTAMLRTQESPPDAGPIRLLRACVQPPPASRAASAPAGPIDLCPASPPDGMVSYPWLVAVGGVVAQECGRDGFVCSRAAAASAPAAAAAAKPASAASAPGPAPMYSVSGGFVVPFYVVILAFVGGVVNLTRRVPEYQKRSSCQFEGTATESKVTLLEAREFVVFQIMQLLTAPFVAMVAYYALEPKSIASAAGLAFVSGFATESVLLLIRGMVNGLRPETTKTTATSSATTAKLHVVVKREGVPTEKVHVELRSLPTPQPALKAADTDAKGEVVFTGLSPGTLWVFARLDVKTPTPAELKASQQVNLVSGQTESIELQLA